MFTLYALVLLCFVCAGLGVFLHHRYTQELADILERSQSLVQIAAPTIADSAVIGDYDTIHRTLEHVIHRSDYSRAGFIDVHGGRVETANPDRSPSGAPAWLQQRIRDVMTDTNLPINVGGRDYGVLRLRFAAERIAEGLWLQTLYALGMAAVGLAGGLLLLRIPLGYWLNDLTRIESFEARMRAGHAPHENALGENAPIEFKQTFDVLNRAAASIQAQREQASATLGAIGDGVLTLDMHGRILLCNPAARQMLARSDADLVGHLAHTVLPEVIGNAPPQRPWQGHHCHVRTTDGTERVFDSNLSPINGPTGAVHGHVLALRDVTEQHTLNQRLRSELATREQAMLALRNVLEGLLPRATQDQETPVDDIGAVSLLISQLVARMQERSEQLNAIFALSPDGFASFDSHHCINYVSPGFIRLTGKTESQLLGLHESQFAIALAAQCSSGQELLESFSRLRSPATEDGQRRRDLLEVTWPTRRVLEVGLRESSSQGVSQVLHLRDVTHESEVEQMKSEFLSTAAHELRTPMASIFGFSELMMTGRLPPERQRAATETIHRQTQQMISIVNEMLDLARIEARRGKDFALDEVDLRELTQQVLHDFKPPGGRRDPSLAMPDAPVAVHVDRGKVAQALGNVLSNAYKYSPGGGDVDVRIVLRDGGEAEGAQAGVQVQDHGIGMTADQLARVCERFYRADHSGSIPGTGLGMSIVKEIVELLGGSLALKSEPGRGSVVTLWLPLATQAAPETVAG